jgi:hypothetical protein
MFYIVEELERRHLPTELALLPFIESAFNPDAVSRTKAVGIWQFMPLTGREYDLRQNSFRDDRQDVVASTNAALDYLESLYAQFGDWHLALAAYNWGQGNVRRAIAKNKKARKPTGYLDLRMPNETRLYVPKLQAVEQIVRNPEAYGLTLPEVPNHPFFESVTIDRDIDVALVAKLSGISETDFRKLNPAQRQPVILSNGTPEILLPWITPLSSSYASKATTDPYPPGRHGSPNATTLQRKSPSSFECPRKSCERSTTSPHACWFGKGPPSSCASTKRPKRTSQQRSQITPSWRSRHNSVVKKFE